MLNIDERDETEELKDVDAYFVTLRNPYRFTEIDHAAVKPTEDLVKEKTENSTNDRFLSMIMYPKIISHACMAET